MLVIDPAQDRLVAILLPFQRRVLLAQSVQRGGQLDVVAPVAGGDRQRRIARLIVRLPPLRRSAGPQNRPAARRIQPRHGHHLAFAGAGLLGSLVALDRKQCAGALGAVGTGQFVALTQGSA